MNLITNQTPVKQNTILARAFSDVFQTCQRTSYSKADSSANFLLSLKQLFCDGPHSISQSCFISWESKYFLNSLLASCWILCPPPRRNECLLQIYFMNFFSQWIIPTRSYSQLCASDSVSLFHPFQRKMGKEDKREEGEQDDESLLCFGLGATK